MNTTMNSCPSSLQWSQSVLVERRPILYVCIIAIVTHSIFWLQLVFCSSVRQKNMQWLYAYLATDILLLLRFFFLFIVHTTSYECTPNMSWFLFICYLEAIMDNYLNILEVYILLALNICRYLQIARNTNAYVKHPQLMIGSHLLIYLIPLLILVGQICIKWAYLDSFDGQSCDLGYSNIYTQILNAVLAFALPIGLNILVIIASIHHIHSTSKLQQGQYHLSAKEKYHRSLVIQFLAFYTIWISLWSPNILIYQFTSGISQLTSIGSLLNFIEIAVDPIIIGALDIRFCKAWRLMFRNLKNRNFTKFRTDLKRIGPTTINTTLQTRQQQQQQQKRIITRF